MILIISAKLPISEFVSVLSPPCSRSLSSWPWRTFECNTKAAISLSETCVPSPRHQRTRTASSKVCSSIFGITSHCSTSAKQAWVMTARHSGKTSSMLTSTTMLSIVQGKAWVRTILETGNLTFEGEELKILKIKFLQRPKTRGKNSMLNNSHIMHRLSAANVLHLGKTFMHWPILPTLPPKSQMPPPPPPPPAYSSGF